MSKRKSNFDNEEEEEESTSSKRYGKYSLDSDEDDNQSEDSDVLDEEDIEGQEEGAATIEGGIRITPFNMKDEMEEGYFDIQGMYHWKKEKNVRDNWMENVDWEKISEPNKTNSEKKLDCESSDESAPTKSKPTFDSIATYRSMLQYMYPKETVAKALRRLGGNKDVSSVDRWKKKKAGVEELLTDQEKEDKEKFSCLTELADNMVYSGNMDVYQESYEKIQNQITTWEDKQLLNKPEKKELDMYSDDFETKEQERLKDTGSASKMPSSEKEKQTGGHSSSMWEYKSSQDSDDVSGPHTTEHMHSMITSKEFKGEVWVRKAGSSGPFYTSRRIDFDLYL